jgi:hypothetical protein
MTFAAPPGRALSGELRIIDFAVVGLIIVFGSFVGVLPTP